KVPIGQIVYPNRIVVYVAARDKTLFDPNIDFPPSTEKKVKMEIYTGWIGVNWDKHPDTGGIATDDWVSFLCPGNQLVQRYQDDLLGSTVTAAPSDLAPYEDEANLFAVDSATVTLRQQGESGRYLCLEVKLRALNTHIRAITYQATVL